MKKNEETFKHKGIEEYKSLIFSIFIFVLVICVVGIITFNREGSLKITTDHIYVDEGESYNIEYKLSGLSKEQLIWESSDEDIATVVNGKVKGKKEGSVKIIVSDGKLIKKEITVNVISKEKVKTSVTSEEMPIISYSCADGWELKGKKCYLYTVKENSCLDGFNELGGLCFMETSATEEYSCTEGYTYIGGKCI